MSWSDRTLHDAAAALSVAVGTAFRRGIASCKAVQAQQFQQVSGPLEADEIARMFDLDERRSV